MENKVGEKTHAIITIEDKVYCKVRLVDADGNILDSYKPVEGPKEAKEYYQMVKDEMIKRCAQIEDQLMNLRLQHDQYHSEIEQINKLLED